jgi:hypothetical protein
MAALAVGVLTSCGGTQDQAAAQAADTYAQALAQEDTAKACSVLAPSTRSELEKSTGKSCSDAVLDEAVSDVGSRLSVHASGTMAQVRFAQDTVFLTRFKSGWRVLAAACTPPDSPGPYDCQLQGG